MSNRKILIITFGIFIVFFISEAYILYKRKEPSLLLSVGNEDIYTVYAFNLENNKQHKVGEYWAKEETVSIPMSHFEETNSYLNNYLLKIESDHMIGFLLYTKLNEDQIAGHSGIETLYNEHYNLNRTVKLKDKVNSELFTLDEISNHDYNVILHSSEQGTIEPKQGAYIIPGFNDIGTQIGELFILSNPSTTHENKSVYQSIPFREITYSNGEKDYDFMIPYKQEVNVIEDTNQEIDHTQNDLTLLFNERELVVDVLFYTN